MKPTKSPRLAFPPRGRSSRTSEHHASKPPSADDQTSPRTELPNMSERVHSAPLQGIHPQVTNLLAQDPHGLDIMRRRMSVALAKKQEQRATSRTPPADPSAVLSPARRSTDDADPTTDAPESSTLAAATLSTDSARTVKATPFDMTPGTVRTPSYPFPRMHPRLQRAPSARSGPHHRPFTLLSPTNDPASTGTRSASETPTQPFPSETSTPMGGAANDANPSDDPNYPTPDLYDVVLMLNTEPGLDCWWANVMEILSGAYGAERASLALPGDVTDLENVPWGRKATFNIYGADSLESGTMDSVTTSDTDSRLVVRIPENSVTPLEAPPTSLRPPLLSRHSIAGVTPEVANRRARQRPAGPVRAISTLSEIQAGAQDRLGDGFTPRLVRQSPGQRAETASTEQSAPRCSVHRSLQPLESESDPLLARTGVATLFGKRKPVVLTRAYGEGSAASGACSSTPNESPLQPESFLRQERGHSISSFRAVEEYEQPEPSPWSQSPSPSPAARSDPTESPFFLQTAAIDEDAFEQNPPIHDYGATANQSLHAIGTDFSKTLVHVPLIQPVPSRNVLASGLRFPVAILSFLSPVNPYPRNLRQSLTELLPHLAGSFSIAQQYSSLQERLRGASATHGATFGLGGTFSDEGSELELVAELSTQLHEESSRSKAPSVPSSVYSPSERNAGSVTSTPFLDQLGMSSDFPGTPGKTRVDMVDSYFLAKRNRPPLSVASKQGQPTTPGARTSTEESPEGSRRRERAQYPASHVLKKPTGARSAIELTQSVAIKSASVTSESLTEHYPGSGSDRSDALSRRMLHRDSLRPDDGERPLPELISALMLNAVPLQLFLAKPTTGDLVWTNRKFDAFRSQGEGRVRDPWKNVHDDDRPALVRSWTEALKTGSQFTHYVQIKRFNSDNDFRWFVFRASTLLSHSGRLLYWIGSFMDVHEQYIKNLEAQEKEATMTRDAKLRALADAIPQVLFEAMEGEGIVSVNQQWYAYSGQSLDEARGLGFARHVHRDDLHKCGMLTPGDVASVSHEPAPPGGARKSGSFLRGRPRSLFAPDDSSLEAMIQQGSMTIEKDENGRISYTTEIRLRSKGGEFRWFLVRLVKVHSRVSANGYASWYGTCTDIEVRMGLERELNEANKKIHSEMESKTKFFANMSHEIRTPLNGILGSMPWLVESALDLEQRRTVDTIQNSASNLRELVDNILDVTKVEAGKMTLQPRWFEVRRLCEEVVDTCSSRAIERNLGLNYSLEASVPNLVRGDPFRVRQVLLNLIGNSVKFTSQGEVFLRCYLGVSDPKSPDSHVRLHFDVTDTGRGFNELEFQRLFKQFGQIEGASQHDAGSGLGLFLSKQLVEMHGGELSVKSKTGEGSTFGFYIRVEPAPPGADTTSPKYQVSLRPGYKGGEAVGVAARSHTDSSTPTLSTSTGTSKTASTVKYTPSETQSPSMVSPPAASESSAASVRSNSGNIITASSMSSLLPTPDSMQGSTKPISVGVGFGDRQAVMGNPIITPPSTRRSNSDVASIRPLAEIAHPQMYLIAVICPAEHARGAIRQHIEHVIPHQIPHNVITTASIDEFRALFAGSAQPNFTHIVLDLPEAANVMLFMRGIQSYTVSVVPTLVVITDYYQKRDILEDFTNYTMNGRRAFLVHKPVKPSVFAMIFDPAQVRNLSKDRAREVAQNTSDNFKLMATQVKEAIGGRRFRLLLVEDSDVNRMVIQRYLKRVGLESDEARNGQECVDKVTGRPQGHYSLIICDIQMPIKNGYEACTEVRQWESEHGYTAIPIMALTANAMPQERAAAAAAGFSDYLTKPVDFNRLGGMMMTLLDGRTPHMLLKDQPSQMDDL